MSTETMDEEKLTKFAGLMRDAVRSKYAGARFTLMSDARALWNTMTQTEKNEAERRSEIAASGVKGSN